MPPARRKDVFLLYWGMSTGGAFLDSLAHQHTPDGYLGWGTSSTGLAYLLRKARQGDDSGPYSKTAVPLLLRLKAGPLASLRRCASLGSRARRAWQAAPGTPASRGSTSRQG